MNKELWDRINRFGIRAEEIADELANIRDNAHLDSEKRRYLSLAITELQSANNWIQRSLINEVS